VRVEYSNGISLVINHGDVAYSDGKVSVEAKSYLLAESGD
jgi:hypothetical protein